MTRARERGTLVTRHPLGSEARPLRVALIGAGPSAFYAAEALFKSGLVVRVDMLDRLPTPFGLVRGGVAPDHQKIKSVLRVYEATAAQPGYRFFGNVMLGRDVEVDDLVARYDQIVYAVGNESDRPAGIPGEDLAGVHSATAFVGWYNGHPDFAHLTFELDRAERVAVIGNGNVAMDVTRVLAQDPERLAETDIADYALKTLRRSRVREILLLGRRGPAQAAFSPKEIQEVGDLAGCDLVVDPGEVEVDEVTARWMETGAPRPAHRNLRYLIEQSRKGEGNAPRKVRARFLVSPVELRGNDGHVRAVRLQRNELYAAGDGTPRPRPTARFEEEEVQLVFKAIGYRGVPIRGVPFEPETGIIPNIGGRVVSTETGRVTPGQYVVGWAKRGPTGLIGTNSPDSKATVAAMLQDIAETTAPTVPEDQDITHFLQERGIDYVTYEDWQRLDAYELERGRAKGKVRDKICSVGEMLAVIRGMRK